MPDQSVMTGPLPFEDAAAMRSANAALLKALDQQLGTDSSTERETEALQEMEPKIRDFLHRGAATGARVEDIRERTACQVLLDYWTSTLSHAGIGVERPRLAAFDVNSLPELPDDKCPYVGLEPITQRTLFFGREITLNSLLERVSEVPLVVVQGGSGSGKSSLVMAGALPALTAAGHEPQYRLVRPFSPGNLVLESLVNAVFAPKPGVPFDRVAEAATLRTSPARLPELLGAQTTPALLVIDQFDEVFTLSTEEDRAALAAAIDALSRSNPACRVILTMREEFSSDLSKLAPLRLYLEQHATFSMKEWPVSYDELKAAVEQPAALVNLHFAPGIVDDLVKSVLGQDSALPLLQFALQLLWKKRDHNRITREAYDAMGSPLVALERHAEDFFKKLGPEAQREDQRESPQQLQVRRILLEFVRVDRLMEASRKPQMLKTLLQAGNELTDDTLVLLAREGFIRITPTIDGDATVEVKQDALLRNWPRYVDWINGKRWEVRRRVALTEAAQRWDARGRSATANLLTAGQLEDMKGLTGLSQLEVDYLQASKDWIDEVQRERVRQAARQKIRKVTTLAVIFGLVLVAVGSLTIAIIAQINRDRSRVQADFARALEASYRGQIDDAFIGTLRAGVAMNNLPDKARAELRPQLREALLSTLQNTAGLKRLFMKKDGTFNAITFHPTRPDSFIAFGGASDGRVYLASLAGAGERFPRWLKACDDQGVSALAFEPQGRFLVVGCRSGRLAVWSAADWHQISSRDLFNNFIRSLSIRRDGRFVAASGAKHVVLIELDEQGNLSGESNTGKDTVEIDSVAFSPIDDTLVAGDDDGNLLTCLPMDDGKSWDCKSPQDYKPTPNDAILTLAYAPDGKRIAVGHFWRGVVDTWDPQFPAKSRSVVYHQSPSAVYGVVFFQACKQLQLAIGTDSGLDYSPVDPNAQEAGEGGSCAKAGRTHIGDQTYNVAFDSRHGLIAAATQAGYVAVIEPDSKQDLLRKRLSGKDPDKTLRGALLSESGSTAWLASQDVAKTEVDQEPEADPTKVAIFNLRDGKVQSVLRFKASEADIQRLTASPQSRRLVTIACTRKGIFCSPDFPFDVTVWQFPESLDVPKPIVSLKAADFAAVRTDFKGKSPLRAILSPDGRWLVVSVWDRLATSGQSQKQPGASANDGAAEPPPEPLLVLRLDDPGKRTPISSNLLHVKEIAFSEDGKRFAAGGCCSSNKDESGRHQVRLWSVDETGLKPQEPPLTLSALARSVQDVVFASDQRGHTLILAGGLFGAIDSWDLVTGKFHELRVDTHAAYFIASNKGQSLVAAAAAQGIVRLWDTSNWDTSWSTPLQLTPSTDDPVPPGFLVFSGNGAWLATSAEKVDFWDLDAASLQRKACALLSDVGVNGVEGTPWHDDKECKEGVLTPPPRSIYETVQDFFWRAWAALLAQITRA